MLNKLKKALMGKKEPNLKPEEPKRTQDEPTPNQEKPKTVLRTHYTQNETEMIQGLFEEGYSTKEIASKMNRTVSGIKNLRQRMRLTKQIKTEIPTLINQKETLVDEITNLRIEISLKKAHLDKLKNETAEYEELKKVVELYHTHGNQIRKEIQALIQSQADIVAIQRVLHWFEKGG